MELTTLSLNITNMHDKEILNTYFNDMYRLINKNLAEYAGDSDQRTEDKEAKIQALLAELFKVNKLQNENIKTSQSVS